MSNNQRRIIAECIASPGRSAADPFYPTPQLGQTFTEEELFAYIDQVKRDDTACGHEGVPLSEEDLERLERIREELRTPRHPTLTIVR